MGRQRKRRLCRQATDFSGGILPSGTVNFTPGQGSQLISENVSSDTIVEASENFQVVMSSPSNGATFGAATASGVIINDDGTLAIAPVNADRDEGASAAKRLLFTVAQTGTLSRAHAATWSGTGSGAHPASATDFAGGVLPSDEVRFAPGQRIATIAVSVAGDTAVEADEHFTVTLSGPALGYGITTASAVGTIIINDDADVLIAGNISLAARTTFAAGPVPSSVIAVDLDLDGNLDLAVPDFSVAFRYCSVMGLVDSHLRQIPRQEAARTR